MIEALEAAKGMVYLAAKHLGCSHTTVYNYIKRYASVRLVQEQTTGEFLDSVELKLYQAALRDSKPWAIQFALRTKGKQRGYTEARGLDITTKGEKVETNIIILPAKEDG